MSKGYIRRDKIVFEREIVEIQESIVKYKDSYNLVYTTPIKNLTTKEHLGKLLKEGIWEYKQ